MPFIPRAVHSLIASTTPPQAVVIVGPRRCGKTTLVKNLVRHIGGEVRRLNCDLRSDVQALHLESKGDVEALLRLVPTLVIDEAQKVPDIGNVLKLLVDENEEHPDPPRIFVTSSTSLALARNATESAVGRYRERRLWPFSVKKLANQRGWDYVQENLANFLIYGMYPQVVQNFDEAVDTLLDYRDGILFRDVFLLTDLRRGSKLADLVAKLSERIGSEIRYESLGAELGLSKTTVEHYIDLLVQCNVVKVVPSFAGSLPNELKKGKKIFFTDLGIRNAVLEDFSPFSSREDAEALRENFFFIERLRMHDFSLDRKRLFFWHTKSTSPKNLDFIEVRNRSMEAFYCTLSTSGRGNPGDAFSQAYPDCPVHVVTPCNILHHLGMPAETAE